MGVAHAGNLLIPGRIGEPLRVFLLAELDVAPEYGTSAVVQERLADQVLRVVFLAATLVLTGMSGGGVLAWRMLAVTLATVTVFGLLVALIRNRKSVSESLGYWLGRLPRLNAQTVSSFVIRTLEDIARSGDRPGGRKALFWGFLSWLIFAVHTDLILRSFFPEQTLAFSCLILAFSPPTAPTQPGLFHGMALAAMMMLGAEQVPALQGAVVIHMMQMVVFTVWGVVSWFALGRRIRTSVAAGARQEIGQDEAPQSATQVSPSVDEVEGTASQSEAQDNETHAPSC